MASQKPTKDSETAQDAIQAQLTALAERVEKSESAASAALEESMSAKALAASAEDRAAAAESRLATAAVDVGKEQWEARLRYARGAGPDGGPLPVQEFWLTQRCHMQQVGDVEPQMVYGAPERAVRVLLPKFYTKKYQDSLRDEEGNVIHDNRGRIKRGGAWKSIQVELEETQHLCKVEPAPAKNVVRPEVQPMPVPRIGAHATVAEDSIRAADQ